MRASRANRDQPTRMARARGGQQKFELANFVAAIRLGRPVVALDVDISATEWEWLNGRREFTEREPWHAPGKLRVDVEERYGHMTTLPACSAPRDWMIPPDALSTLSPPCCTRYR